MQPVRPYLDTFLRLNEHGLYSIILCVCGVLTGNNNKPWTKTQTCIFHDFNINPINWTRENRVWIWSSLLDGIVFAVGLVKPVPNFVAAEYLLVLATPLKLFLYGVNCSQDGGLIYSMRDYDTSSLGTTMRCMVSTSSGRMFLAGCDGHIYELLYSTGPPCGLQFTMYTQSNFMLLICFLLVFNLLKIPH